MDEKINFLEEISNYIFLSKYSRYNEKLERRETWKEAVDRLEAMHIKRYDFLPYKDKAKINWAFDLVRDKRVVPSMRSLQFGGKAIEAKNERIYNCFHRDTKFITENGVKSFNNFNSGDETTVLTDKGQWKKAKVVSYDNDYFNKITFSKGKHEILDILATADHRWILRNGEITQNLKVGDSLKSCPSIFSEFVYNDSTPEERLYWCYGYVYGDGTIMNNSQNKPTYSMVRLCDHAIRFKNRFIETGFNTSSSLSLNGDFMAYTGKYLKTAPNPDIDSPNLIRAFVKGYLDADGEKNPNNTLEDLDKSLDENIYITIQSSEIDHIWFIRKCFPVAGVYIISETDLTGEKTNFGIRPYTIKFRITQTDSDHNVYKVKTIDTNYQRGQLWCLEVEDDKSFVFPNGLTTGNCAVRHIDSLRAFSEVFYLLLCGCGVGLGLSNLFLNRIPDLVNAKDKNGTVLTYQVLDTIEGWADSIEALLMCYFKNTPYTGRKIVFDYSRIRPAGSPLKTGGGKAPGYKGLKFCHQQVKELLDHIIEYKHQNRLKSIDACDIVMHCADAVLSGGVRRSSCSVIFEKTDMDMMNAKINIKVDKVFNFNYVENETLGGITNKIYEGKVNFEGKRYEIRVKEYELKDLQEKHLVFWKHIHPQRARSNNSVLLIRNETTEEEFKQIVEKTKEWGEPGFVWGNHKWQLFNPCFEIGFIPVTQDGVCGVQMCNLTSQNGGKIKSKKDRMECMEASAIIGTLQAGYTNFPYLNRASEMLTREEALLGCSITGIMDNPEILLNPDIQSEIAQLGVKINQEWAEKILIKPAARVTCVKPEGTSSLVLGTGSGIHPHHAKRYFRRVMANKMENIYKHFRKHNKELCEQSVWSATKTDDVIAFPIEVADNVIIKDNLSALEHLNYIKSTQQNWVMPGISQFNKKPVEHNVSCTVIVKDNEWDNVIKYIFDNRKFFAAVSLLPNSSDKAYPQSPMESITNQKDENRWNHIINNFKSVNYKELKEDEDNTKLNQEVVCAGGACQII